MSAISNQVVENRTVTTAKQSFLCLSLRFKFMSEVSTLNLLFGYYDNSFLDNYYKHAFIRDHFHAIGVELRLAQNNTWKANEILSAVIDLQRQRTSAASQCAGYDCPVYPVLFNDTSFFFLFQVKFPADMGYKEMLY